VLSCQVWGTELMSQRGSSPSLWFAMCSRLMVSAVQLRPSQPQQQHRQGGHLTLPCQLLPLILCLATLLRTCRLAYCPSR
jgi:hypothetical protein